MIKIFEGEKKKTGGKEDDGTEDCYKTGFSQSGGTRYLVLIFSDLIELPFQGEGYHLCFESVNLRRVPELMVLIPEFLIHSGKWQSSPMATPELGADKKSIRGIRSIRSKEPASLINPVFYMMCSRKHQQVSLSIQKWPGLVLVKVQARV